MQNPLAAVVQSMCNVSESFHKIEFNDQGAALLLGNLLTDVSDIWDTTLKNDVIAFEQAEAAYQKDSNAGNKDAAQKDRDQMQAFQFQYQKDSTAMDTNTGVLKSVFSNVRERVASDFSNESNNMKMGESVTQLSSYLTRLIQIKIR